MLHGDELVAWYAICTILHAGDATAEEIATELPYWNIPWDAQAVELFLSADYDVVGYWVSFYADHLTGAAVWHLL